MKKYFFFAAAALVALAACSKIETVESTREVPISFSVMNHLHQTKATTGLEYPQDVPFGTFAWWTSGDWTGVAADQTYVFMDNQEIAYSAGQWAPTTAFYWTKSGKITFASYSPYVTASTAASKGFSAVPEYDVTNGYLFNDYTIVSGTNVDLMYANLAQNCTKSTNTYGTDVYDGTTGEGATDHGYSGVPTIFNHALCQINFAFRAIGRMNPNVDRIVVVLNDVDIANIDNKGTFTQNNTTKWSTDHDNFTAGYDFAPESPVTLALIDGTVAANVAATDNYTNLGTHRILLPQALLNSADAITSTTDQLLIVNYTIKMHYTSAPADENDPLYWATETVTSKVRLNNGTLTAWSDNQNITYRISINPYATETVTFDPAVLPWTDVYSTDVNLNEND